MAHKGGRMDTGGEGSNVITCIVDAGFRLTFENNHWPAANDVAKSQSSITNFILPNSISFGKAPRREADSQPISQSGRQAVSQAVTSAGRQTGWQKHTVWLFSVADHKYKYWRTQS